MKDIPKHETLRQEGSFWTYSLRPGLDKRAKTMGKVAIYAINPGPANALLPLADRLSNLGSEVILKLDEPAKSKALRMFVDRLDSVSPYPNDVTTAVTCGHIDISRVTKDIMSLRSTSPNAKIITVDDNFDTSLPLIEALDGVGMLPDVAFIMNKKRKTEIERRFKIKKPQLQAIVVNNPSFSHFYDHNRNISAEKKRMRAMFSIKEDVILIGYFAPAEGDYPVENGIGHNDLVLNLLRQVLQNSKKKIGVLYRPHTRGTDYLPGQLLNLPENIQVIYHPREWWNQRNITLHNQLIFCDIVQATNSTLLAEMFTAWGNRLTPIAIPVNILLTEHYTKLPINSSLMRHRLSHNIQSANQFMDDYPKIIESPEQYKPINAPQRLKDFGWEDNPLEKMVSVLTKI